ncbi:CaiB/BaiF CoA transferase family protein [Chloroflexota bacterium]
MRVIDFTQAQQGPVGTVMLADWGADVIKVERPGVGDQGRRVRPWGSREISGFFEAHNRNKRSITVDIANEKGKEIIYRLVESGDIFAQNFRPGVAERLGFGYEALSHINPMIIYLTGSSFGLKGPLKNRPGRDSLAQAMGGIASITGPPGAPDVLVGPPITDQTGGYLLGFGALLALFDRERTGKGQEVDVSLLGNAIGLVGYIMQDYLLTGHIPEKSRRRGGPRTIACVFKAKDGKSFVIHAPREEVFSKIAGLRIAGLKKLSEDKRFDTDEKMLQNVEEMIDSFETIFATKKRDEWLKLLVDADIDCAPVYNLTEVATEPQVIENEYIIQVNHPTEGPIKVLGSPVKLSKTQAKTGVAPKLGQHTEEVLREAGYSDREITELKKQEIV